MASAFLDSSALIESVFRNKAIRDKVEALTLNKSESISSRYVIFEISRGYLASVIALYNKSLGLSTFSEVHEYAHTGQQIFKRHRLGTMLGVLDDFFVYLEQLGQSHTPQQLLLMFRAWLRQHIRRGWAKLRRKLINPVGCREDIVGPSWSARTCVQKLPKECGQASTCKLDTYLTQHRTDFESIVRALLRIENPDPETIRRIAALQRLLTKPLGQDFDGKDCHSCGDAIICHESPVGAVIVTKNGKHFKPICVALNKPLEAYS